MKKLLSLSIAGIFAFSANAQKVERYVPSLNPALSNENGVVAGPNSFPTASGAYKNAKATVATPFVTDTFSANSLGSGGWVAGGNTGSASWRFTNKAATGAYNLGTINSTSKAGGWMLYDADSIGKLFPTTTPQIGTLTSPSYSCTGHSYVGVRFQQYTKRLRDTFFVNVSNNGGSTWTRYNIFPNNGLGGNEYTANPETTTINITATAANQANVKIQFYYTGVYPGGTYNWLVDDFALVDLDPIDLGVHKSAIIENLHNANGFTSFGSIPKNFVDSMFVKSNMINYGGTAQFNATVSNTFYKAGAPVISKSIVFANMPVNAFDSLLDFSMPSAGVASPTIGTYASVINVNQTGDGNAANNTDSVFATVTDTTWTMFPASSINGTFSTTGGYYLQRGGSGSSPAINFYTGSLFEVGAGKKDTLTSVDMAFYPLGGVGAKVRAEFYLEDLSDPANPVWNYKGSTVTKTLTAADIPASGSIIWSKFMAFPGTAKNFTIFSEGEWAVVVTALNPASSLTAVIYNANGPKNVAGKFGLSDTSNGLGSNFGTRVSTNESVPLLRLNFSNDAYHVLIPPGGVKEVSAAYELKSFPNPANNQVTISFKSPVAANASVQLMNTLGQIISTQTITDVTPGQEAKTTFNTSQLAAGIYYYSVKVNGSSSTNRVVVSH